MSIYDYIAENAGYLFSKEDILLLGLFLLGLCVLSPWIDGHGGRNNLSTPNKDGGEYPM